MSNLLRARVAFQGAALCRVYSRHCFLRNLPANVSQKFQKKLEIVETWGNSPEYFTVSSEWWRKFAKSPTTSVIVPGRYEEKLEDSPNLKSFSNPGLGPLFQTTLFGSDCALHTVRRGGAWSSVLIQEHRARISSRLSPGSRSRVPDLAKSQSARHTTSRNGSASEIRLPPR